MDPRSQAVGDLFANLSDHNLRERVLRELYSESVVFQDPIQRVEGLSAFRDALASMEKSLKGLEVRLVSDAVGENQLVIRWEMDFRVPLVPFTATLPGVSWMEFDAAGKCYRHTDYCDMLGMFAQLLPFVKPIQKILQRAAA